MKRDHLVLLTSVGQVALFVPVAWWVHKHPHPTSEVKLTHIMQKQQFPLSQSMARAGSTIAGSSPLLNALVVPTAFLLWKRGHYLEAMMTPVVSWVTALVRAAIQSLVSRPRPSPLLVQITGQKGSKSFPSGHVTSSLAFWGWLFALGVLGRQDNHRWRKVSMSLPALFVVLVGPTRIYLGEHWTTDVLGGYLFGGGSLGLFLRLYLYFRDKNTRTKQ